MRLHPARGRSARSRRRSTPPRRARHAVLRVWATVLTLLLATTFIAVTGLTLSLWLAHNNADTNPVTDLGFLVLGVLITAGIALQIRAPETRIAGLRQSAAALLALAAAGLIGGRIEPLTGGLAFLATTAPLIALHSDRRHFLRLGRRANPRLGLLTLIAAVPATVYAAAMLTLARHAGPSCFLGRCATGDRYAELAALAIAILLTAALATFTQARTPAWSTAAAAATLGAASVALPTLPGSMGTVGGALTLAWATLFLAAAATNPRLRSLGGPRRDPPRGRSG